MAPNGERDLATLLRSLQPELDGECWTFCTLGQGTLSPQLAREARVIVREREGLTLVLPRAVAAAHDLEGAGEWAQITLRVHSSLEAVGMMAAVASALAAQGISVNPVSGYYHDHLFVPWQLRDRAMEVLRRSFP